MRVESPKIRCMVTERAYPAKPVGAAVGGVRVSMRKAEVGEMGLCDAIAQGRAWMPAEMDGGHDRAHWSSQQLIGLDFDNAVVETAADGSHAKRALAAGEDGYVDVVTAYARLRDVGIFPMCIYYSYSSSEGNPRFRVVICLDEPCEDPDVMEMAIRRLLHLFPEADRKCSDLARFFYGTDGTAHRVWRGCEVDPNYARASIRDILELPAPAEDVPAASPVKRPQHRSGRPIPGHVDVTKLNAEVDLLAMVRRDTGEYGHASGRYVKFRKCPVCGHRDCFVYYPENNTWTCFSSSNMTGIAGGRVVDYVMARDGLTFKQALAELTEPRD